MPYGVSSFLESVFWGEYGKVEETIKKSPEAAKLKKKLTERLEEALACGHDKVTALYVAACRGHTQLCDLLLKHGAAIDKKTIIVGETPLHGACRFGFMETATFLIERGADVSLRDSENRLFLELPTLQCDQKHLLRDAVDHRHQSVSYCFNPDCTERLNVGLVEHCASCAREMLLRKRFRGVRQLGVGGFATIYIAADEDLPTKRLVAVKQFRVMPATHTPKSFELFQREAKVLELLSQLNTSRVPVPSLLANFSEHESQYIVMDFVDGEDLKRRTRRGLYGQEQMLHVLRSMLAILRFLHACGVVHRDIKPANIVRRSSDAKLFLVDFGCCKILEEKETDVPTAYRPSVCPPAPVSLQRSLTKILTVGFAPPEQSIGQASYASDIFSLGMTCVSLLTGSNPGKFMQNKDGTKAASVSEEWCLDNLPLAPAVARVIARMVAPAVASRYASADDVVDALSVAGSPTPLRRSLSNGRRRMGSLTVCEAQSPARLLEEHEELFEGEPDECGPLSPIDDEPTSAVASIQEEDPEEQKNKDVPHDTEVATAAAGAQHKAEKAGWMSKRGGGTSLLGTRDWRKRWFVLTDATIAYHSSNRLKGEIPVSTIIAESLVRSPAPSFGFQFTTTAGRTYFLRACDEDEREEWMAAIVDCVRDSTNC